MQQIVECYCPQTPEDRDLPADPMRALDYETFTGEKLDPVAASWLPYCLLSQWRKSPLGGLWRPLAGSMRARGLRSCPRGMNSPSGGASGSQAERCELYRLALHDRAVMRGAVRRVVFGRTALASASSRRVPPCVPRNRSSSWGVLFSRSPTRFARAFSPSWVARSRRTR
jgi:hypothetical protein